jgi:hypothetical protein
VLSPGREGGHPRSLRSLAPAWVALKTRARSSEQIALKEIASELREGRSLVLRFHPFPTPASEPRRVTCYAVARGVGDFYAAAAMAASAFARTLSKDLAVQAKGRADSFHSSTDASSRSSSASRSSFIHEQWTGVKCISKRGSRSIFSSSSMNSKTLVQRPPRDKGGPPAGRRRPDSFRRSRRAPTAAGRGGAPGGLRRLTMHERLVRAQSLRVPLFLLGRPDGLLYCLPSIGGRGLDRGTWLSELPGGPA